MSTTTRTRRDLCPGVLRPWPAEDGHLVRLRVPGGQLPAGSLAALVEVAREYGDGDVHLTGRANLQLRGLGDVSPAVVDAIEATGLLPSRSHELVRNVMASPLTGLAGGRTDLRPVVVALDRLVCADPALAALPGRFLFVLDDGRGDLAERSCDLGLVALDDGRAQLRVGPSWGTLVPLADAAEALVELARRFLDVRGEGPEAPWHVAELPAPLVDPVPPDPRAHVSAPPLPYGAVAGGTHVEAPDGVVDPASVADAILVTPWRGVLVTR
ncbi:MULTISPECIES: nitrite reductase [unclassified Nocardioides]|uniref:nitrite reductase n=1 Tax=unclassified Nocardioides TaxID=2615069 RepID=UPI0009F15BA2|nr:MULTISPECIES: nitrite reductase [unclassified Nocardioides]GAW50467.1 nitrite/Sulfite reductase ferredoxin-like half domain protein [Nocardioides sp. PD653-B2]GAW53906.1 nitrite/Sulfite reductase ferredoxin-like half domain protein [Nocardioides sp. PD653]